MVLHTLLLIIMQKSKLINMILSFWKKALTFHNVIIHNTSVWNKDQNHYYYEIFLRKCSYHLSANNDNKSIFV